MYGQVRPTTDKVNELLNDLHRVFWFGSVTRKNWTPIAYPSHWSAMSPIHTGQVENMEPIRIMAPSCDTELVAEVDWWTRVKDEYKNKTGEAPKGVTVEYLSNILEDVTIWREGLQKAWATGAAIILLVTGRKLGWLQ